MSTKRLHISVGELQTLTMVLAATEAGTVTQEMLRSPAYLSARRKLQQRLQAPPSEESHKAAFEDAVFWHEHGECSLMRSARLAAAYHKVQWTPVYERLRRHFSYRSGRLGQGIYPRVKREERAA